MSNMIDVVVVVPAYSGPIRWGLL